MIAEGSITIDLPAAGQSSACLTYRQAPTIEPVLIGKNPDEAVGIIGAIHALCGNAQAHAAVMAFEAALDCVAGPSTAAARSLMTAIETLREHALRIVLDWPRLANIEASAGDGRPFVGLPSRLGQLVTGGDVRSVGSSAMVDEKAAMAIIDEAETLIEALLLGEPVADWLKRENHDALIGWTFAQDTVPARLIRHLAQSGSLDIAGQTDRLLQFPDRASLDQWRLQLDNGAGPAQSSARAPVPESTPYSRRTGDDVVVAVGSRGLGARFIAVLAETARLPGEMRAMLRGEAPLRAFAGKSADMGIGSVEAARGILVHGTVLRQGRVERYRLIAPTDWNFHAGGIASRCLDALPANEDAERRKALADLVVHAIDPCVSYEVRVA